MRQPLIDADILLHEYGWSGEFKDKESGEVILLDFEHVGDLLDTKIQQICEEVDADCPPILYITNSEWLTNELNRRRRFVGEPEVEYKPVFRHQVAVTQPYKGNRKNPKPFHFYNIIIHLLGNYEVVVSEDGLEADDMMCIEQVRRGTETIICSRDKDLRICPGWHYSWECGKQKAIGPEFTDKIGSLQKIGDKVVGYGLKFFYYQMLVGDTADYIPGLKGWGMVKAYDLLANLNTEEEIFNAVKSAYIETMGLCLAKDYFLEQANLLWMIQEKDCGFEIPTFCDKKEKKEV